MPRTEAGKRLIGHWASHSGPVVPTIDRVQVLIDAIEAEAFAAGDRQGFDAGEVAGLIHERARIRAAVAKYIAHHSHEPGRNCVSAFCAAGLHSAVLAIIDEEDTDA